VLGLAAIILSFPYDVPSWMPSLLLEFATFISDPLPIKATVKRTFMEFWRTHSDMWEAAFKSRFTSEQLSEITQLIVSPSYFV
jgi:proteasome activator subunit 4